MQVLVGIQMVAPFLALSLPGRAKNPMSLDGFRVVGGDGGEDEGQHRVLRDLALASIFKP